MHLLSPSQIKILCEQYGLSPSKHYGQHYLISATPIEQMIEVAELSKNDTVVEIGPGFGVLTLALAPKVKKAIAFEIEQKLKPYWEAKAKEYPNVEIVWGNALQRLSDFRLQTSDNVPKSEVRSQYKVLANLPYQITSQALRTIFEAEVKPSVVVVMVQKEVAKRICAKAGGMNLLGLSVQYYGMPRIVCDVPRGSFWPQPKVDSAVVEIDLSPEHLSTRALKHTDNGRWPSAEVLRCCSAKVFFRVAKAGFSHKRKQLWRNLSEGLHIDGEMVKSIVREIAGNEKARAEELSIEMWRELARKLSP